MFQYLASRWRGETPKIYKALIMVGVVFVIAGVCLSYGYDNLSPVLQNFIPQSVSKFIAMIGLIGGVLSKFQVVKNIVDANKDLLSKNDNGNS